MAQENMTQLLLTTKLFFPRARSKLVSRPRLIERLNAGLRKPLTLISAPAGYGKTTLLSDWRLRRGSDFPLAWLSLDPDDNNLARFLTYISAALETLKPALAQELVSQLQLPELPAVEELITALIHGVNPFPQDFALVLDDCHVITEPAIHQALAYLLDHMPPKMHLVMLTRSDPPIPLAKLRVRGDMEELRADDLRFSTEEAFIFLNSVMDLDLSVENVSALDQRTEGWAVGLQIAALSLQNKADADAFIKAFTGSNRYILDFLSEEVIQGQTEEVQAFILQTSILDRLSGPLCDAVLGGTQDSAQMLLYLERRNLFLIPLDDERQWYRYHHLFSELLFRSLKQTRPEVLNELYERAAAWLEANGYMEKAIGYALKAQNYEFATRLMYQIRTNLLDHGEIDSLISWLNTLPEELVRSQPELCFSKATNLTMQGYFDDAEKWLQLAESGFHQVPASDLRVPLDQNRFLTYRSIYARFRGDFTDAIDLGQRAVDLTPKTTARDWGVVLLFLAQAHFYAGNTDLAEQVLQDAIHANLASGHMEAYLNSCHNLAQLKILQGRLQDARTIYEHAAQAASEHGKLIYAGTEHACLGDLKREWNQLDEAAVEIQKGVELAEAGDHIFFLLDVYLSGVRLALVQKDWEVAWSYLQKAERVARRCTNSVEIAYLEAWKARLQLAQGNFAEAELWAETSGTGTKGIEIVYPFPPEEEWQLLTLARVLLTQGKTDQAKALLERIRIAAENAGRCGRALEAQMLQALADQAAKEEKQAVAKITQVLARAEPEGYVRLFIDEGALMAKLLYKAATGPTAAVGDYAKRLLAVFSQEEAERPAFQIKQSQIEGMVKPLSERELEMLRLVAQGKTNKEIAAELFITIGTVKRHAVNIYTKLDAKNRTEAVAKARELGLLVSL
jgi:LuxR family maltose regulon positive regulatory protein